MHFFAGEIRHADQQTCSFFVENDIAHERWRFTDRERLLSCFAACDFKDQLCGQSRRAEDVLRIDATFETITGIAVDDQTSRGAANATWREICRFENDVCGRFGHPGSFAAHHASDGERLGLIRNDKVVRRKRVGISIQSEDVFAFCGLTHDDSTLQFIGIKNNPGITEVHPALPVRVNGYLSIAGIASSGSENITLQFGYGKEVTAERNVRLNSAEQNSGAIDVSRLWAQKKLSDLDVDYAQHKEEISSLGRQFGLVTRNTSLLVLESVEDYIRYGITPPAELMAAYRNAIKRQAIAKETRQQDLMKQAIEMAGELKTWWNTVFKAEKVYPTVRKDFLQEGTTAAGSGRRAESVRATAPGYRSPAAATAVSIGDNRSALSEVVVVSNALAGKIAGVSIGKNRVEERPVIIVPEFKSDKDYMKRINGSANQAYAQYLLLRKQYQTTPSFYLDISNWFQQHDDAERALMILSNLTELDLENAEIYKTLTYKLRETGNVHAELFTSKKVLEWRPMDAQSHRDYALALADCGYYQQALATLYNVLNKSYSMDNARRDEGIEEIIIAEINNLISLRSEKLNTAKLNKKILFNFPVDVRVVINWNKKDTDIDLWLTDPTDEKCFYSHPETRAGGRISDDFTAGYGPEQFMIKKAVKGRYKIEVNYYGDQQLSISGATTVMAEIYTHYGSINQQRKVITLQLSGKKADGVFIGEFTF